MATTQYIGARYVPLFAEPIEWDKTKQYEPLTIVTHNGNSYTSRQFVPTGIEITNEAFWALTGNYNAQIEQYRKEVAAYDGRITTAQGTADSAKDAASAAKTSADAATAAVAAEKTRAETKEADIQSLAETNETDIAHLDAQMACTSTSEMLNRITNLQTMFPMSTDSIADGAITANKIAQSGVASILNGFTIHRFDNKDSGADNSGLIAPSDVKLSGFYIEELSLLVIDNLYGTSAWLTTENTIKLPDYVPHVNKTTILAKSCVIRYENGLDFKSWTGIQLMSNGYLRPVGNISDTSYTIMGTLTFFLRPYVTNSQTMNDYGSLVSQNGVL